MWLKIDLLYVHSNNATECKLSFLNLINFYLLFVAMNSDLGLNPGCRDGKPAINRLSYGTTCINFNLFNKVIKIYALKDGAEDGNLKLFSETYFFVGRILHRPTRNLIT
jgi:hypothetical protein